jgi:hypothetical protein
MPFTPRRTLDADALPLDKPDVAGKAALDSRYMLG